MIYNIIIQETKNKLTKCKEDTKVRIESVRQFPRNGSI